jgi:hypothetical protein
MTTDMPDAAEGHFFGGPENRAYATSSQVEDRISQGRYINDDNFSCYYFIAGE